MGYKRYFLIVISVLLGVFLDAVVFTAVLGEPYSRVPMLYHLGSIVMLTCAIAVAGDRIFKAGMLR